MVDLGKSFVEARPAIAAAPIITGKNRLAEFWWYAAGPASESGNLTGISDGLIAASAPIFLFFGDSFDQPREYFIRQV